MSPEFQRFAFAAIRNQKCNINLSVERRVNPFSVRHLIKTILESHSAGNFHPDNNHEQSGESYLP